MAEDVEKSLVNVLVGRSQEIMDDNQPKIEDMPDEVKRQRKNTENLKPRERKKQIKKRISNYRLGADK